MSTDTEQDISIDRSIGDFRYDVTTPSTRGPA